MADPAQDRLDEPRFSTGHDSEGRPAALVAWGLYILSLPTGLLLAPIGLIVAYAGRSGSDGLSRAHIDAQIRLFWSVFWWTILLWIGFGICIGIFLTTPALGQLLILFLVGLVLALGLLFLTVWFTVKSLIGLINLLGDKAP